MAKTHCEAQSTTLFYQRVLGLASECLPPDSVAKPTALHQAKGSGGWQAKGLIRRSTSEVVESNWSKRGSLEALRNLAILPGKGVQGGSRRRALPKYKRSLSETL